VPLLCGNLMVACPNIQHLSHRGERSGSRPICALNAALPASNLWPTFLGSVVLPHSSSFYILCIVPPTFLAHPDQGCPLHHRKTTCDQDYHS
jgi:hypothetical protein